MLFILVGTSLLSFVHLSATLGNISLDILNTWPNHLSPNFSKLPVFLENSSFEIFFGQKIFQILRKQLLQKTPTSLISISIYILHPLLLSSTQSQTAGQPWHYCCKSWSWFESCLSQCPLTDSYRATSRTDCDILCGYLFIRLCRSSPL